MAFLANPSTIILILGHVFLSFCVPGILLLDTSHCDFYLIACEKFLYSYSIDLCSGIQLNYLETV